jgi:hypothetical protein
VLLEDGPLRAVANRISERNGVFWTIEGRRKDIYDMASRWSPRGALCDFGRPFLQAGPPAPSEDQDLLTSGPIAFQAYHPLVSLTRVEIGSAATLAALLPSIMAAILSEVRSATARSGSSFKWA